MLRRGQPLWSSSAVLWDVSANLGSEFEPEFELLVKVNFDLNNVPLKSLALRDRHCLQRVNC